MPKYISSKRLQIAVERLRTSKAQTRMNEFLILKRGITLDPSRLVKMSLKDANFKQAIDDLMKCFPIEVEQATIKQPLVNVYGTSRASDFGYREAKYYSNGINSAISGTPWNGIADIKSEGPRVVGLHPNHLQRLEGAMLLKSSSDSKPRLDDSAMWFFRAKDISEIIEADESREENIKRLIAAYRTQLGLIDEEVNILFNIEA
jgi:hypothetical protein